MFLARKPNWDPKVVNVDAHYNTTETWLDKDGKDLHPHTNYYVGGNTKFYGAALFRLRKEDFGELHHHGGISPAWPISYDELGAVLHAGGKAVSGARQIAEKTPPSHTPARLIPGRRSAMSLAFSSWRMTSPQRD